MVKDIGGVSPENQAIYKDQFERGLNLFQKSLQHYQTAEGQKKEVFKDVMSKALTIMNETAKAALGKNGEIQEKKLERDYKDYIANNSAASLQRINTDISRLQNLS